MKHYFEVVTIVGSYEFLYDQNTKGLCFTQWPNGDSTMRIIASGLPKTIEEARVAAKRYVMYIETDYQSC
jgi:hypothetical protein